MNVYDDEENVTFVMARPEAPAVAWPLEEEDALPHVPDQPVAAKAAGRADLCVVPRLVLQRWL
eukprot:6467004-Heterocapsa_arctica.AAC.1